MKKEEEAVKKFLIESGCSQFFKHWGYNSIPHLYSLFFFYLILLIKTNLTHKKRAKDFLLSYMPDLTLGINSSKHPSVSSPHTESCVQAQIGANCTNHFLSPPSKSLWGNQDNYGICWQSEESRSGGLSMVQCHVHNTGGSAGQAKAWLLNEVVSVPLH